MVIKFGPKPGDLRVYGPADDQRSEWIIPFDKHGDILDDAVYLADHIAAKGIPRPRSMTVQRYGDTGWADVPADELQAARGPAEEVSRG